nr:MAG TPA: hypothetical protein [Caudoviricetes sp.]
MFTGNRSDRKSFFANNKYEGNLLYNRVIRCVYKGDQKTFV